MSEVRKRTSAKNVRWVPNFREKAVKRAGEVVPRLPYHAPPGQSIPGAYAVPYTWGHHPAQVGSHGEQMQMQSDSQRAT